MVHKVAALADVQSPWDFTLRELLWRKDALQMERWDIAAWICAWQPRMTKQQLRFENFHPLRGKDSGVIAADGEMSVSNIKHARELAKEYGLPKNLTNEERMARWEIFERKMEARERKGKGIA